jgi:hypothetical protein
VALFSTTIRTIDFWKIKDDRGNVESTLVLIPLLSLFLIATQLTIAVHARNMEKASVQSDASVRGISGEFTEDDTFLHIYSPDPHQNLDLIVSHRKKALPALVPGLSTVLGVQSGVDVSGIAVVENQR